MFWGLVGGEGVRVRRDGASCEERCLRPPSAVITPGSQWYLKLELVGGGSGWAPWGKRPPATREAARQQEAKEPGMCGDPHRRGNGGKGLVGCHGPRGKGGGQ